MSRHDMGLRRLTVLILCCFGPLSVWSTLRYYNTYDAYGTGDTIISTFHVHFGPSDRAHKWNVECLDGEAMIGIGDATNDFARVDQVWCKFMFPNKPPAQIYPYYTGCHVRNFTDHFFCFDANDAERTLGSFITETLGLKGRLATFCQGTQHETSPVANLPLRSRGTSPRNTLAQEGSSACASGLWANNFFFHFSDLPANNVSLMKCCAVPTGYYIDYMSCYYVSTHDEYFEYYDNPQQFITYCATGYVATGIAKKISPYNANSLHPFSVDWLQCCRVSFGPHQYHPPPVTYAPSGAATYYSSRALTAEQISVPAAYRHQYRNKDAPGHLDARSYDEDDGVNFDYTQQKKEVAMNTTVSLNRPFMGLPNQTWKKQAVDLFGMDRKLRIQSSHLVHDRSDLTFSHNTYH